MIELKDGKCLFTLTAAQARSVFLAGEFNDWSPTATPMREVRPGQWQVALRLPPGDYRFRYFTSHRGWLTDWAAFGVERNPFGEWNSIVHVPAKSDRPAKAQPAPRPEPVAAPESEAMPLMMPASDFAEFHELAMSA